MHTANPLEVVTCLLDLILGKDLLTVVILFLIEK